MNKGLTFLDLFAGGGGLSEGFIKAGFTPVAHVEADKAACFTLKTRMAYHWLKNKKREKMRPNEERLKRSSGRLSLSTGC